MFWSEVLINSQSVFFNLCDKNKLIVDLKCINQSEYKIQKLFDVNTRYIEAPIIPIIRQEPNEDTSQLDSCGKPFIHACYILLLYSLLSYLPVLSFFTY